MKRRIHRILMLAALFASAFAFHACAESEDKEPGWRDNVLMEDHGAAGSLEEDGEVRDPVETAFGNPEWKRDRILGVYVLDTLKDMPEDAVDLSASSDRSVMGWMDENDRLYIAGEGGVKAPEDASALFGWYQNAKEIDLGGNLHTEDTTDFRYMFYHDYAAEKISLEGIDSSKAETFSKMFAYCESVTDLDFSSFDTASCESFYQMFIRCDSLKKLDLSTFSCTGARTLALMFYRCADLEEILFSQELFDTSNVRRMTDLFLGCSSLSSLDVSWFQMGEVRSVKNMFMGCRSLPAMNLLGWDLKNVKNHQGMFSQSPLQYSYGENGETLFERQGLKG